MPTEVLYPTYGVARTLTSIKGRTDWKNLDPEFARRCAALLVFCGGQLGYGGGWRSSAQQEALFRSRYHVDPNGAIFWNGQRWTKNPGVASAAPPGVSYHEGTTIAGKALAVDFTADVSWLKSHGHHFGLHEFSAVNNEPWHAQPVEIPNSRRQYVQGRYEPLVHWTFPGEPEPEPIPEPDPDPPVPTPEDDMPKNVYYRNAEARTFQGSVYPAGQVKFLLKENGDARRVDGEEIADREGITPAQVDINFGIPKSNARLDSIHAPN